MTKLKNGTKSILSCSMCGKSLLEIWITQPNVDMVTKVQATCPYCPERSFVNEVRGKFHAGPIFHEVNPETFDDVQITVIKDVVNENNKTTFIMGVKNG